jgi:hypothetical protein
MSEQRTAITGSAIDTAINSLALAMFSFGSVGLTQGNYAQGIILGLTGMGLEFFKYGLRRWKRICSYTPPEREREEEGERLTVMLNDLLKGNQ